MQLINCRECGKVCIDNLLRLCPECTARRQVEEEKVMAYLRERSQASLEEICQATGVKEDIVMDMLRRGRLVNRTVTYKCEACGAPITAGRLCDKCSRNIVKQASQARQSSQQTSLPRDKEQKMHIHDLIKKFKG